MVMHLPTMWETGVQSLDREDPLEKEVATHSSTPAWKMPWTEEPGRLQSMGSQSLTGLSDFTYLITWRSEVKWCHSVVSDSLRPRGPTRLLRPWDSPGKNTGVGCHFLLQGSPLVPCKKLINRRVGRPEGGALTYRANSGAQQEEERLFPFKDSANRKLWTSY